MKCPECNGKIEESEKFCNGCGTEITQKKEDNFSRDKVYSREEPKERVIIREVEKKSSGLGGFLAFLIIIGIIIFIIYSVVESGVLDGAISKSVDPCKRSFEECNYACGEGWLSGACKTKCSYEYNSCKGDGR
ncbi:hypothetical protein J4444_01705 [Candidatus Woesearchaeota archaeon]|nr:hypothetical protein [Candidatus Woesearchaeota archaeon]